MTSALLALYVVYEMSGWLWRPAAFLFQVLPFCNDLSRLIPLYLIFCGNAIETFGLVASSISAKCGSIAAYCQS